LNLTTQSGSNLNKGVVELIATYMDLSAIGSAGTWLGARQDSYFETKYHPRSMACGKWRFELT
jgi:hypothetical protein